MRPINQRALVVGCADTVWSDLDEIKTWYDPDLIIAVNHIGAALPEVDMWVSLHAAELQEWALEAPHFKGMLWSARHILDNMDNDRLKISPYVAPLNYPWDGTSSSLGVFLAQHLKYPKILLCGVPMENGPHYYGAPNFTVAEDMQANWKANAHTMPEVRSMSGFTMELLGRGTRDWWDS